MPEARHLNLTCISGFEATGVERAPELVPLITISSQRILRMSRPPSMKHDTSMSPAPFCVAISAGVSTEADGDDEEAGAGDAMETTSAACPSCNR